MTASVQPTYASYPAVTWKSSNPDVASVSGGTVTVLAPGKTTITVTTADGGKTASCEIIVTMTKPITASSGQTISVTDTPVYIDIPEGVDNASIYVTPETALPRVEINSSCGLGNIQIQIPAGTIASGPAGWGGTFSLPEIMSQPSSNINGASQVDEVFTVGLNDEKISFSRAVRILISGKAGKQVGYVSNGVFIPITRVLSADSQSVADNEIPANSEGKIDVDSDLVVWTKHFTEYVVYTVVDNTDLTSHTVKLAANYGKAGTVTGGGTYSEGTLITVKAAANSGYVFEGWTEGANTVSEDVSYSFNLGDSDRSLTANFIKILPEKLNQAADKSWTISFSQPINAEQLGSSKIYVATDEKGNNQVEGIQIEAVSDNPKQILIKPSNNWLSGQTYYIFLETGVQSLEGQSLNIKTRMKFTVQ